LSISGGSTYWRGASSVQILGVPFPSTKLRKALGADNVNVMRLVLKESLVLSLIGVGIGLAAAFGLTRLISSQLYGVTATDPVTFSIVSVGLVGIALLASYVPARRAVRTDPMEALRAE